MTPEQLLEATTKALFRTCAFATCDFEHADEDIQESYRVHARAALRIAIEAAAKVADEQKNPSASSLYLAGSHFTAVKIAVAIRSLLPTPTEGE